MPKTLHIDAFRPSETSLLGPEEVPEFLFLRNKIIIFLTIYVIHKDYQWVFTVKKMVKFSHFEKSEKGTKQCCYGPYHRGEWYETNDPLGHLIRLILILKQVFKLTIGLPESTPSLPEDASKTIQMNV